MIQPRITTAKVLPYTVARVLAMFVCDSRRLRVGEEVSLSSAYARVLITDGTVVAAAGLPARRFFCEDRMMVAGDYCTRQRT